MNTTNKIHELIDKGDPLLVFQENYLIIEIFQELLKLQLVDVVEDKIVLTSKGEEAKAMGFDNVIAKLRKAEEPRKSPHRNNLVY